MRAYLNQATGYLINWDRPGSLFFNTTHHYTERELLERFAVITGTATGAFLAWYNSYNIVGGASIAFLIVHSITMAPLIWKRLNAMYACYQLHEEILIMVKNFSSSDQNLIQKTMTAILNHSDVKSPSAVWGKRKRLLDNLKNLLNDSVSFSTHDLSEDLRESLQDSRFIQFLDTQNKPIYSSLEF